MTPTEMKTIFITVSSGAEIKNFMLGDFYKLAKNSDDIRLVVFVPAEKIIRYKQEFNHERCIVEPMPDFGGGKAKQLFQVLTLASIPTATIRSRQRFTYLSGGSLLAFWGKRLIWLLGHRKIFRALLRAVDYHLFREDRVWEAYFIRYNPDVVFAPALKFEESMALMKAAKRQGIPCVGMTGGWDNISSKLFLRVHPDLMLVQNPTMLRELMELNDYPAKKIRVVGFPQWDHYKDPAWEMSKAEVAKIIGVNPEKRWITYFTGGLLIGGLTMEDLRDQADILTKAIESGEIQNAQLLVRIHPLDKVTLEAKNPSSKVLDFGKGFNFSTDDIKLLANLVRLSEVTINFGSTMTLEAAIFDRPVISIGFNGYNDKKIPVFKRLSYALDNATHYFPIEKSGGVWRAKNPRDFVEAVKNYLQNPQLHHEGRLAIMRDLVGPQDGNSSRRVLEEIVGLIKPMTPK